MEGCESVTVQEKPKSIAHRYFISWHEDGCEPLYKENETTQIKDPRVIYRMKD
jgi:hypothetical protein